MATNYWGETEAVIGDQQIVDFDKVRHHFIYLAGELDRLNARVEKLEEER